MYPIYHFILSMTLSGFLLPFLGWKLALFWLGSFFIDVDHYWWYILKFKKFGLKEAIVYSKNLNYRDFKLHIFHVVEFWILMAIWSLYSELAFAIFIGVVFHIIIDFVDIIDNNKHSGRALSFFEWIYKTSSS